MLQIFLSYSSKNRAAADVLSSDLESLGHEVWFDTKLSGGQAWWDEILLQIRACDLVIVALTPQLLDSYPCRLEYGYAVALNKRVLPVLLIDVNVNLLPPSLSTIQFVDYRQRDPNAVLKLSRAISTLPPAKPLPVTTPEPPTAPISPLNRLAELVDAALLNSAEQKAVLFDLKELLAQQETHDGSRELLTRLYRRDDLIARVAEDIRSTLGEPLEPVPVSPPLKQASPAPASPPPDSPVQVAEALVMRPPRRMPRRVGLLALGAVAILILSYAVIPKGNSSPLTPTRPPAANTQLPPASSVPNGTNLSRADSLSNTADRTCINSILSSTANKLAYITWPGEDGGRLYLTDATGAKSCNLIQSSSYAGNSNFENPVWSPDGKRLAVQALGYGGFIFLLDIETSNLVNLTSVTNQQRWGFGGAGMPTWSPHNKSIAFTSGYFGGQIIVMNIDGADILQLPKNPVSDLTHIDTVAWAPDSKSIAYVAQTYVARNSTVYSNHIFVSDLNENARRLTNASDDGCSVAWSPDGKLIAYAPDGALTIANVDGSSAGTLTNAKTITNCSAINWSPDGKSLAYATGSTITVIPLNGSTRTIAKMSAEVRSPTWSRDGKQIAFTVPDSVTLLKYQVYVVNADGSGLHSLTATSNGNSPAWR